MGDKPSRASHYNSSVVPYISDEENQESEIGEEESRKNRDGDEDERYGDKQNLSDEELMKDGQVKM